MANSRCDHGWAHGWDRGWVHGWDHGCDHGWVHGWDYAWGHGWESDGWHSQGWNSQGWSSGWAPRGWGRTGQSAEGTLSSSAAASVAAFAAAFAASASLPSPVEDTSNARIHNDQAGRSGDQEQRRKQKGIRQQIWCRCSCDHPEEGLVVDDDVDRYIYRCECKWCGPKDAKGIRRCQTLLSLPINLCEDCRDGDCQPQFVFIRKFSLSLFIINIKE